jgi:hypothetical protein
MKLLFYLAATTTILFFASCKKSETTINPANPLSAVNGNWYVNTWGGVPNNIYVFKIDQNLKTGVIQSLGSQPFGYTVGETILSNMTATANANVFTSNAIFKYGVNNGSTANTTATLTLQNNNTQLLVQLAAAQGVQPNDWTYLRQ